MQRHLGGFRSSLTITLKAWDLIPLLRGQQSWIIAQLSITLYNLPPKYSIIMLHKYE